MRSPINPTGFGASIEYDASIPHDDRFGSMHIGFSIFFIDVDCARSNFYLELRTTELDVSLNCASCVLRLIEICIWNRRMRVIVFSSNFVKFTVFFLACVRAREEVPPEFI